jgi:hypothetical protein
VLARGSDGGMAAPGAQLPGSDEPQTDGRCPPGPPGPLRIGHAPPRIVALRAAAAGGLFVLLRRDEGCGILLDEVGIDGDGNAGAPRRLNTVPLSRDDDGVTLLDRDSPRRSILVTKTTTGRVAVAGTPTACSSARRSPPRCRAARASAPSASCATVPSPSPSAARARPADGSATCSCAAPAVHGRDPCALRRAATPSRCSSTRAGERSR